MGGKKAFIFDTNFIMQNKDLRDVVSRLSNSFVVYVTQVSIEERYSQEYLKLEEAYRKIENIKTDLKGLANVAVDIAFEQAYQKRQQQMQKGYKDLFGDKIIPFSKDAKLFEAVWGRIHKKLPPFNKDPKSSDKGFKDSALWITVLEFFKSKSEQSVVFITGDSAFLNNTFMLEKEFKGFTGKNIEIKNNDFYKSLVDTHGETSEADNLENSNDKSMKIAKEDTIMHPPLSKNELDELRVKIKNAIGGICRTEVHDSYNYDPQIERNFILKEKIDEFQSRDFILGLRKAVDDHLLHDELDAKTLFSNISFIKNGLPISIQSIEFVIEVFDEVQSKMPNYLDSFFKAVADILNINYEEELSQNPFEETEDDGDLPF